MYICNYTTVHFLQPTHGACSGSSKLHAASKRKHVNFHFKLWVYLGRITEVHANPNWYSPEALQLAGMGERACCGDPSMRSAETYKPTTLSLQEYWRSSRTCLFVVKNGMSNPISLVTQSFRAIESEFVHGFQQKSQSATP